MAKAVISGNTENITAAVTVSRYYYLLRILFSFVLPAYLSLKKTSLTMGSRLIDILRFQETEMQSGCKEVLILLALYREITLTNGSLIRQNISEEVSKVR